MLHVHRSNRVERLVERLAQNLALQPLADPMTTEQVVVHSQGMQRWLSQRLSQRLGAPGGSNAGICANVEYPFPASVVRRVLGACLAEDPDAPDPWEPDRLVWTVLETLPELSDREEFALLAKYLDKDKQSFDVESIGRRRFALARRIADIFDRYAVYRPRMARAWSAGEAVGPEPPKPLPRGFEWQPLLWKAVQDRIEAHTLAERFDRARQLLSRRTEPLAGLPERINFFGLSALPPSYLAVLTALARAHDVHMYLLCPSREYWGEIRSRRQILAQTKNPHEVDAALAFEGNPILSSFGRLARDFQLHLESQEGPHYTESEDQPFENPGEDPSEGREPTMLEVVQSDILALRTRGAVGSEVEPVPAATDDRSIQVHACHGITRQVEVLRDSLLALMESPDSTIEPRDIVVMAPDIETYAPVISAVFSGGLAGPRSGVDAGDRWGDAGAPQLPFAIADRSLREINPVASALMHVLEMVHGRVEASTVLDLLRMDVVRQRFDIEAEDMQQIEEWVRRAGIRWGIDADHREKHDQPGDHENTWRFGLDRLLLGVAMADEEQRTFGGAIPFDDMEGGTVELLGRFAEFCETLFAQLRFLDHPRPLEDWIEALNRTLEILVRTEESAAWLVQQVREVLTGVVDRSRRAEGEAFGTALELDAVRSLMSGGFEIGRGAIGHQTGAITFCAMVPMRSIPHRVVCLIGMDDGAFPRADPSQALDLMAVHRQIGDRSPREEDRFLFLEALLAARDHFLVVYTGHDIHTNEDLPPAVPVGQLLDVLDASFTPANSKTVRGQVTVQHPLQAFSPRNFAADAPLSYDRSMFAGATMLSGERGDAPSFFAGPLEGAATDEEDTGIIELGDLIRFWQSPVAALVSRRLGIYLREDRELVEDREPVELNALERWAVGSDLLTHRLRERPGEWEKGVAARGGLPPGAPGECAVEDAARRVERLLWDSQVERSEEAWEVGVDLRVGEHRLIGTIKPVHGPHLVRVQFGRVHPKHRLTQWIQYLALNAMRPELPWDAAIFGNDKTKRLAAMPEEQRELHARLMLETLVRHYLDGQNRLLPYFSNTSQAFASAKARNFRESGQRRAARNAWKTDFSDYPGEDADPYHVLVFGPESEFDRVIWSEDFASLACEIWDPILAAEKRAK